MPIYEYGCQACGKHTSVFVRSMSTAVRAKCEHCGSAKLRRLISRVVVARSKGGDGDFDESLFTGVDENDPRSMAKFARRMRDEMGEEMGLDFDDAIAQMEDGQMPDDFAGGVGDDWSMDD